MHGIGMPSKIYDASSLKQVAWEPLKMLLKHRNHGQFWVQGDDGGMRQMTLAHQAESQRFSKKTRREQFLEE
jgi:hypothetical protein